jgi:hypothetical protein
MSLIQPRSLREIAETLSFNIADVAYLSGLEESTISRLWNDPDWLEKIRGKTLQAIISVLPGVAELVTSYPLAVRRERILGEYGKLGVGVNRPAIKHLIALGAVPEQFIGTALETGLHVLRGEDQEAAKHLSRFWARDHDYVLSLLFDDRGGGGLLRDNSALIAASKEMAVRLAARSGSFHAFMGYVTIVHHVAKATGEVIAVPPAGGDRQQAFTTRSSTMGLVISMNDIDAVERYSRSVASQPLLRTVEDWAFPTYVRDARPTSDFTLPRSLALRQTATEVLGEIEMYNEAYLYYLSGVYIPMALQRDPTFGDKLHQLGAALEQKVETCSEAKVRDTVTRLHRKL